MQGKKNAFFDFFPPKTGFFALSIMSITPINRMISFFSMFLDFHFYGSSV